MKRAYFRFPEPREHESVQVVKPRVLLDLLGS